MRTLWPLAFITFKEGIRNRAVYGVSFFVLLLFGADLFVVGMIPHDIGKVAVDFTLATISLSGFMVVVFVGINLLAKDLDRRTIYMVLSKPVSRSEYMVGKFFGMVLLLATTIAFISMFALGLLFALRNAYGDYFQQFSWPLVLLGIFFIFLMLVMLSALTFLFSSFSSTSFVTLVLTIVSYLIGQSLGDVKALIETPGIGGEVASPFTLAVVRTAYYLFPNLSFFDIKMQAAHGIALQPSVIGWTLLYGIVYTTIVMIAASLLFRRKEFP